MMCTTRLWTLGLFAALALGGCAAETTPTTETEETEKEESASSDLTDSQADADDDAWGAPERRTGERPVPLAGASNTERLERGPFPLPWISKVK